jgi:hypothetical protein
MGRADHHCTADSCSPDPLPERLTAAFRGIGLHVLDGAGSGVPERAEQEFWLVAGVGFEPT